jgi:hypothetical protein
MLSKTNNHNLFVEGDHLKIYILNVLSQLTMFDNKKAQWPSQSEKNFFVGFKENPKPEYDVYYGIDLSPLYQTLFQNELNQVKRKSMKS